MDDEQQEQEEGRRNNSFAIDGFGLNIHEPGGKGKAGSGRARHGIEKDDEER